MREIAVVGFAQTRFVEHEPRRDEVELVREVVNRALAEVGIARSEVGFFCSGSCDYVQGVPFSFVAAVDALGAWPPISESHVEMDGAFALYEAYIRLQHGDIDTALVYAFGKPSLGDLSDVLSQQLDPYTMGPLWADPDSLAALQARALIDRGKATEADFARIAARSLVSATQNPAAHAGRQVTREQLLDAPPYLDPLRRSDCGTRSDGAACVILQTRERAIDNARTRGIRPAFIRGLDHRIESMQLGLRDLTRSASTELCAARLRTRELSLDVAELHARYAHEELILGEALGLSDRVSINPSGGCFGADAPMVSGLVRIGEVAQRIFTAEVTRGLAHASSGPCLQQNLVCLLEGE